MQNTSINYTFNVINIFTATTLFIRFTFLQLKAIYSI